MLDHCRERQIEGTPDSRVRYPAASLLVIGLGYEGRRDWIMERVSSRRDDCMFSCTRFLISHNAET